MRIAPAPTRRQELGQFLSPAPIAALMAGLAERHDGSMKVLDPGAGAGALSAALVEKWCKSKFKPERIAITAFELDAKMIPALEHRYSECEAMCLGQGIEFASEIFNEDFIAAAIPMLRSDLFGDSATPFNVVIMNPPYRKIQSDSPSRRLLRYVGIETSNLYTGFLALGAKLLEDCGELLAITPRSFCNGPYFKSFRRQFLETMSLRRLHLFESRTAAFRADDVLQENIIIRAVKSPEKPAHVTVSMSLKAPAGSIVKRNRRYAEIISPDDLEQFIHLVTDDIQEKARQSIIRMPSRLDALGLEVSTGRVVDFRAKDLLVSQPIRNTLPLIYPCHFRNGFVEWPLVKTRKPNAIINTAASQNLLVESGVYALVKRFSAKEERRRIVACIYDPKRIRAEKIGFENHLNYFHAHGKGIPMTLAKGLSAYLNSTALDIYFRQFNGHTQVNATDLRNLPYPDIGQLEQLGANIGDIFPNQKALDELVEAVLF